jgi:hypothetical protein
MVYILETRRNSSALTSWILGAGLLVIEEGIRQGGEANSFSATWSKFITVLVSGGRILQYSKVSGPENLPGVDDLLVSFRWYDALCINQNDIQERTAQVQLMGEIFKNANPVVAWLGPEGDHSTKVEGSRGTLRKR